MNKFEAYQASLAAQAEQRAAERAKHAKMMEEVQARRDHFAATGEIAAPPPSLNDIYRANLVQLKQQEQEQRREIDIESWIGGYGLQLPPNSPLVQEAKRRQINGDNKQQ